VSGLEIDPEMVVGPQTKIDVHERRVRVIHAIEHVATHAEARPTFRTGAEFGSVVASATHDSAQHHMGVHIDHVVSLAP
jgi:hypothetical protein